MQEIGNNIQQKDERLTIRVGENSLGFAYKNSEDNGFVFLPYKIKNGISMAANLREALKDEEMNIGKWRKTMVLIDSPVIFIPIDEYTDQSKELLYNYSITGQENNAVLATILPSVSSVALYSLNKDLRLVLTDNFKDIKINPVCASTWQYLQRRSLAGTNEKLYAYFHDGKIDICSFRRNRFRFANSFKTNRTGDAAYFILSAWKQLAMDADKDDIYLLGDFNDFDSLVGELAKFVRNIYRIKASADFNRHPLTMIQGVNFDLVTTLL